MPPGIGYGINPAIIMQALRQRGLMPSDQTSGIGQPSFVQPRSGMTLPQVSPMAGRQGSPQISRKPGGFAKFLQTPGLQDALLATGSALLAQKDRAGSLGGALGNALPFGAQAFEMGQQRDAMRRQEEAQQAAIDEAFAEAPPEMQRLLKGLSVGQRQGILGNILMQRMTPAEEPEPVALGANERLVDQTTGEEIVSAIPSAESFTYRDLPDGRIGVIRDGELINTIGEPLPDEPDFADETSLRKEFEGQVETFDEIAESYQKVQASGNKENPTAQDDMSLLFAFMKILDPGSAVREGEYASAEDTRGVPGSTVALYNKLVSGEKLNPTQRAQFVQSARELVESQVPLYQERATYYDALARRMGLDPGSVIRNPFLGTGIETGNPFSDLVPGNR